MCWYYPKSDWGFEKHGSVTSVVHHGFSTVDRVIGKHMREIRKTESGMREEMGIISKQEELKQC